MKVRIEFECVNDAFEENFHGELQRVLNTVAGKIHRQHRRPPALCTEPEGPDLLHDTNGNRIGIVEVEK